jgi:hypothetical protein
VTPAPSKIVVWKVFDGVSVLNVLTELTGWPPLSVPFAVTV